MALLSDPPVWAAQGLASCLALSQHCSYTRGLLGGPEDAGGSWDCQAGWQLLHTCCWVPMGMEGTFLGASPRQGTGTIPEGNS